MIHTLGHLFSVATVHPLGEGKGRCDVRKVLIVDDQYGIRILLKEILEQNGYTLFQAANGIQALTIADQQELDLILLDVKLPGMNGFDILKRVKEKQPEVQVIMMTAYEELDSIKKAKEIGALTFITKPFDISEVLNMVANRFAEI